MNRSLILLLLTFMSTSISAQNTPTKVENWDKFKDQWKTDTEKRNLELNEFKALMKRDGIPPIYQPKFWSKKDAKKQFLDEEPVIVVAIKGTARAYPLSILMYHEIVNDRVGGKLVAVTYCPLCNAAIVFDRQLKHKGKSYELELGVSGMLRSSDMVMWDHQTESWWQQLEGEAKVGELTGARLKMITSMVLSVSEFWENYPDGKILSKKNGKPEMAKGYGKNPYKNYDNLENKQPGWFKGTVDSRLPAMERVINVSSGGVDKIYPASSIREKGVLTDKIGNTYFLFFYASGTKSVLDKEDIAMGKDIGTITVFDPEVDGFILTFEKLKNGTFRDLESKSVWNITGKCIKGKYKDKQLRPRYHGQHFAFAWLAFNPDTQIYQGE